MKHSTLFVFLLENEGSTVLFNNNYRSFTSCTPSSIGGTCSKCALAFLPFHDVHVSYEDELLNANRVNNVNHHNSSKTDDTSVDVHPQASLGNYFTNTLQDDLGSEARIKYKNF